MKLKTTREERDTMPDDVSWPALLSRDCCALEDELARVREELGHAQYVAALKVQEVAAERDKLRERLESAERVVSCVRAYKPSGVRPYGEHMNLENEMWLAIEEHDERFGGRDD